jgi:hypothetical protein
VLLGDELLDPAGDAVVAHRSDATAIVPRPRADPVRGAIVQAQA